MTPHRHPRTVARNLLRAFVLAALSIAMLAGLAGCSEDQRASGAKAPDYSKLESAPGALGDLYAEGDALLEGGIDAFGARLDELRGTPVVVNKWASWCVPCRQEFPFFQAQAAKRGTRVAFIGVNSKDSVDAAETFLRDNPLPYPSYLDPDERLAEEIGAAPGFPATVFFDAESNRIEVHLGFYESESDLAADIREFAG